MTDTTRHALVTGGGRGIGAAVVERLVRDGLRVTFVGRSPEALDGTTASVAALGGDGAGYRCDVGDEADVRRVFGQIVAERGRVDVLVANAGVATSAPLSKLTLAEFESQMTVNATGVFLCAREVVPAMVAAGWGRVVTIGSVASVQGMKYATAYVASKHAALGITRALAVELAGTGVTANLVAPAYVRTDMMTRSIERVMETTGRDRAAAEAGILASVGQHRLIEPDEVAAAVSWLVSDAAGSVNGEAVVLAARR